MFVTARTTVFDSHAPHTLVIAPSAAGKTHFVERYNTTPLKRESPVLVLDGEALVTAECGWPEERFWWLDASVAPAAHSLHGEIIAREFNSLSEKGEAGCILFSTYFPHFAARFALTLVDSVNLVFVLPPQRVLNYNMDARRRADPSTRKPTAHYTSGDMARLFADYLGWARSTDALFVDDLAFINETLILSTLPKGESVSWRDQ